MVAQTRQRLAGLTPDGATRGVRLHDPHARPIAKGRLGKPVESGHKAQIVDNDDGGVLDHTVQSCNPADAQRLAPAVELVIGRTGLKPRTVTRQPWPRGEARRRCPPRAWHTHRCYSP